MNDDLKKYRQHLVETLQKVSESYDKTIITLSSGSLGISFTFIKNFIDETDIHSVEILIISWSLLALSLATVVFSLFFGTLAFKKAIEQVDNNTIYETNAGGNYGKITSFLHGSGAILLILGLFFLGSFVYKNIGSKTNGNEKKTSTPTPPPPRPKPNPSYSPTRDSRTQVSPTPPPPKPSNNDVN